MSDYQPCIQLGINICQYSCISNPKYGQEYLPRSFVSNPTYSWEYLLIFLCIKSYIRPRISAKIVLYQTLYTARNFCQYSCVSDYQTCIPLGISANITVYQILHTPRISAKIHLYQTLNTTTNICLYSWVSNPAYSQEYLLVFLFIISYILSGIL